MAVVYLASKNDYQRRRSEKQKRNTVVRITGYFSPAAKRETIFCLSFRSSVFFLRFFFSCSFLSPIRYYDEFYDRYDVLLVIMVFLSFFFFFFFSFSSSKLFHWRVPLFLCWIIILLYSEFLLSKFKNDWIWICHMYASLNVILSQLEFLITFPDKFCSQVRRRCVTSQ